jgi:putative FmdB family regulatory protein
MPIYEFDCQGCGGSFDKLVRSISAIGEVTCPSCSSPEVKKKLSMFASRVIGQSSSATASDASCAPGGL